MSTDDDGVPVLAHTAQEIATLFGNAGEERSSEEAKVEEQQSALHPRSHLQEMRVVTAAGGERNNLGAATDHVHHHPSLTKAFM